MTGIGGLGLVAALTVTGYMPRWLNAAAGFALESQMSNSDVINEMATADSSIGLAVAADPVATVGAHQ